MKYRILLTLSILLLGTQLFAQGRKFYVESTWKPRIFPTYEEIISGTFWPASPESNATYANPGFDESRLSEVPVPGVHPRVLMTPADVKAIRQKVAMGSSAPKPFQIMWERVKRSKSPFYALVTKDKKLGRAYAEELVKKLKSLESKLDHMDAQPDARNLWSMERSMMANGEPDPPTEIWDLLEYDYIAEWMSPKEHELARSVIARITAHRFSNYLAYPAHFMINNHQGFGMEYIRLMLLIEGQEGFNKQLFERSTVQVRNMLEWFLSPDGMCYETIKGWMNTSAFMATALRDRALLKGDRWMAKMRFFHAAMVWNKDYWMIRDEMRNSAFHVIWLMHYFYPQNKGIDFLYQSSLASSPFLTDANAQWNNPVGICNELLLLWADAGMTDKSGQPTDYNIQANVDALNLPTTWHDNYRGYLYTRNSWKKDDLMFAFCSNQNLFYGGHEACEHNRIILWKDGVNWIKDNHPLAVKHSFLQNMLTIDGKGIHWPPAPAVWLGKEETSAGITATGDARIGYGYYKSMQVQPFAFPSSKLGYLAPFAEANYDLTRDIQVAFHPQTVKFYDGYGHTDYGPWSTETRLVEGYKEYNVMERLYRTVHMAKGKYPYLIVLDDARKDDEKHLYEWNISLPLDVELVSASSEEVRFQNSESSSSTADDLLVGLSSMKRHPETGKLTPQKGDPMFLVRVLHRNAIYGFPVPRFEKLEDFNQIVIPTIDKEADFKVLLYPFRWGDPMPVTDWNREKDQLTVQIGQVKDSYHFAKADGGRTVFEMERGGKRALNSNVAPARPNLMVRGEEFDANALRTTRLEGVTPQYVFDQSIEVSFARVQQPAEIRYTLDGSTPNRHSKLYEAPILIDKDTTLKAVVCDDNWNMGNQTSAVVEAAFKKTPAAPSVSKGKYQGMTVEVFEINTKLYNEKGFFEADKIMMPDLRKYTPVESLNLKTFEIPNTTPKSKLEQQVKAFYRYIGKIKLPEDGVYSLYVNSCGPITLDVSKRSVIENIGVFHQQQAIRKGSVALKKGWHDFELIVCDPLYWNINGLDPMPFDVKYSIDNGIKKDFTADMLTTDKKFSDVNPIKWLNSIVPPIGLRPGFTFSQYERIGKRRDNDLLDIDNVRPRITKYSPILESSDGRGAVRAFNGYFYAPMDGIYTLNTQNISGETELFNNRSAMCQNQILLGNVIVVQRGVYGRNPSHQIGLHKGWHPISIRFGASGIDCKITYPDGITMPLDGNNIFTPPVVDFVDNTVDPLLGCVDFNKWNGKTGIITINNNAFKTWISHNSKAVNGRKGKMSLYSKAPDNKVKAFVDVNVSRGGQRPGVRIYNLKLPDNAISVAMWVKLETTDCDLFGKRGYNAFGKGYRTVSCMVVDGFLKGGPGNMRGPKLEIGKWYHIVLTADENSVNLYLNGKSVVSGEGTKFITTDALDFLLSTPAQLDNIKIYDKAISKSEIENLYKNEQ